VIASGAGLSIATAYTDGNPGADATRTLGDPLRRHRMAAGFTRERLAERAGPTSHWIQQLAGGS